MFANPDLLSNARTGQGFDAELTFFFFFFFFLGGGISYVLFRYLIYLFFLKIDLLIG